MIIIKQLVVVRFLSHHYYGLTICGADLGVKGVAVGTVMAELVIGVTMFLYIWRKSPQLNMRISTGTFVPGISTLRNARHIGLPLAAEHVAVCGAQILVTVIVAPLGTVAIAANAFAITAESLCFMPGYGIGEAATTLVGQCVGAARKDLAKRFAFITVFSGMTVMGIMGVVMYLIAPELMTFFTPDIEVRTLGSTILRIEAWAEPMFAAAIVALQSS